MDKKLLILLLLLVAFISGYYFSNNFINKEEEPIAPNPIKENVEPLDPIKEKMAVMTVEEKIGQMVIVGLDGYDNNNNSQKMIEEYHVGGFILFKRNIQDSQQLLRLINSLKETNAVNKVPLFFSIDEEGGKVSRMPGEFQNLPSSKKIGEVDSGELSYQVGEIIGRKLNIFGFNMNFAPVMDINSNPKNPVIGDRAFGDKADIVSKLGVQTMKGLQSQNIISVIKHFPGHGDTSVDSHIGLPVVNNDLARLKSFELLPFIQAIENNVDAIMIAHILLPKIDPINPSSLSKTVINDILRGDLGFEGVVISDDMTMGAILENYDLGQAAVEAVNAGSDIVLVCHEFAKEVEVINALREAVETGTITMERVEESVYRILKLKEKYGLTDEPSSPENWDEVKMGIQDINEKIDDLLNTYLN